MTTLSKAKLVGVLAELTPLQIRFVEEYIADPSSATRAALRAGYSESEAASYSSKLLKNPKIKAAIEDVKKQSAQRIGVTQDRILTELAKIAFGNVGDVVNQDLSNLTRDQLASLAAELTVNEVDGRVKYKSVKIKNLDKVQALIQLGKHLGMFKEKVEVSGSLSLEQLVEESMKSDSGTDDK
jgi:phage terminase small subunit